MKLFSQIRHVFAVMSILYNMSILAWSENASFQKSTETNN